MAIIVKEFVEWYFKEMPWEILRIWKGYLKFFLNYFSLPLLIKTFFAPWKNYRWDYGRGFELKRYLWVFTSNMISSVLGMIMRSIVIGLGLLIEIGVFLGGLLGLLFWFLLPLISVFLLISGLKYFF